MISTGVSTACAQNAKLPAETMGSAPGGAIPPGRSMAGGRFNTFKGPGARPLGRRAADHHRSFFLTRTPMSEDLIQQYRVIHGREAYGNTSVKNLPYLLPLLDDLKPASIIDFGCGQSTLADELQRATGARIARYDPAIPKYSVRPEGKFDLLVNVDVLEHVPEDELEPIIADMAALARNAIIIVDMGPAVLILPDGRNAHVTQQNEEWWKQRLGTHFPYLEPIRVRSRRRAAFKTWKTREARPLRHFLIFLKAEIIYRLRKITGRR